MDEPLWVYIDFLTDKRDECVEFTDDWYKFNNVILVLQNLDSAKRLFA
jgi:hypothetical protein